MNRQRLLELIRIMQKYSDMDHKLKLSQIAEKLEAQGISTSNRKTFYDDFKTLSAYGYEIEYQNGYYLNEAPFSLSEIKIIIDSLNSLKNLDDDFLNQLKEKLYAFVSVYETQELKKLEYHKRHSDSRFRNRMEDTIYAITAHQDLRIMRKKQEKEETIRPLFLYRENDYYYLYYNYPEHDKIYHTRFDNIKRMQVIPRQEGLEIPLDQVLKQIEESSASFYDAKARLITFSIIEDSEYLRTRLQDDFPNIIFTKEGFSLRASVSPAFFARLTGYGDQIKISDPEIADQYVSYLEKIIIRNNPDHRNS